MAIDKMKSRLVYTIRPIRTASHGDSGQINGLSGTGIYLELPITGEDGSWLEFETFEEAEAEAIRRGYGPPNVSRDHITVIMPDQVIRSEGAEQ